MREKVGKIYKYVNKLDGKVYIGQTTRELKVRHSRHLTDAKLIHDDCYFHRALRKYGESNFDLSIKEDGPFPIRKSRVKNNYEKLKPNDIHNIIYYYLFTDYSYNDIAEIFKVTVSAIKAVIAGTNWKSYTSDYKFPLIKNLEENKNIWKIKNEIV